VAGVWSALKLYGACCVITLCYVSRHCYPAGTCELFLKPQTRLACVYQPGCSRIGTVWLAASLLLHAACMLLHTEHPRQPVPEVLSGFSLNSSYSVGFCSILSLCSALFVSFCFVFSITTVGCRALRVGVCCH
jgi:hypothetical protein